jgi:hypothetical protein
MICEELRERHPLDGVLSIFVELRQWQAHACDESLIVPARSYGIMARWLNLGFP